MAIAIAMIAVLLFGILIVGSVLVDRDPNRCPVCHKPCRICNCGFAN